MSSSSDHRQDGSRDYFRRFWSGSGQQRYAYPRAIPQSQWDLFEREKARLVTRLLEERGIQGGRALEYGCGAAGMSAYLANQGFSCVATDISREALGIARKNCQENCSRAAQASFTVAAADVFHLPFSDATFDVVMSYGLLEHFAEDGVLQALAETRRVLRSGGAFVGDVVPRTFSARSVGNWLNLVASGAYHLSRGRLRELPSLRATYLDPFYENDLGLLDWERVLRDSGLAHIQTWSVRPFPPLAISGRMERLYVRLMERALRFHRWFDQSQSWLSRRWGWTYILAAVRE